MNPMKLVNVLNKYKKCSSCGSSYKDTKLKTELVDEVVTIYCDCGFRKTVDEHNKEVK